MAGGSGLTLAWALILAAGEAAAQSTTSNIQGTVSDETGVLPGATVTARETQSGFQHSAVTSETGAFALAGLRPGSYEITVSLPQYKPQSKTVQVLLGQTVSANFTISPDLLVVEQVQVVGDRLVEVKTAEVATNVTQEQIQYLPQSTRNFLNFAALAPGVRINDDEFRKELRAGALSSDATNVFIDGVSYKNDVIQGGVVGQDASRGNPFPQNAVQEFQVLTQNYKAEYEKASSAVITAVTKSGGNSFHGDIFNLYQDKHLAQNERWCPPGRSGSTRVRASSRSRPTSGGSGARPRAGRSSRIACSSSRPTKRTVRTATIWSRWDRRRARRGELGQRQGIQLVGDLSRSSAMCGFWQSRAGRSGHGRPAAVHARCLAHWAAYSARSSPSSTPSSESRVPSTSAARHASYDASSVSVAPSGRMRCHRQPRTVSMPVVVASLHDQHLGEPTLARSREPRVRLLDHRLLGRPGRDLDAGEGAGAGRGGRTSRRRGPR